MNRVVLALAAVLALTSPVPAQRMAIDSLATQDTSVRHVVRLRDGSTLVGRVTAVTTDSIRVRMTQVELSLPRSGIVDVRQVGAGMMRNGEWWYENPHSTRLLFSSTAFPLEKGTGYYSNAWLFMHTFAIGINDRFTLGGGGTTIPGIALSDNLFYLLPKYTIVNGTRNKVALGALLGFFPFNDDNDVSTSGLLYAVGTTGSRESGFSLGVAWGYADDEVTSTPGLMLGGQHRVGRRFVLITENWFVSIAGSPEGVASYGVRLLGENLSADLAWVTLLGNADLSVPWLGFAFRF